MENKISLDEFKNALDIIDKYKNQLNNERIKLLEQIQKIEDNKPILVSGSDKLIDFDLSIRILNIFKDNNITTIDQLLSINTSTDYRDRHKVVRFRNCGKCTLTKIEEFKEKLIIK